MNDSSQLILLKIKNREFEMFRCFSYINEIKIEINQ